MRRARLAYLGSYHHVMNRGLKGERIFFSTPAKEFFLKTLQTHTSNCKVRLLAYCLLNNHYHIILQNTSASLSSFMRNLNGQYGIYYRKRQGGKGYVFQNRYYSTLIQEDKYLRMAIIYILLNPVRANIVNSPWEYSWSSIGEYFTGSSSLLVDNNFVEELFSSKNELKSQLTAWQNKELPLRQTRLGMVLGDENFIKRAAQLYERRKYLGISKGKRIDDYSFKSTQEVLKDFEHKMNISIDDIDLSRHEGKALRAELLVRLKDDAGLTFEEIKTHGIFKSLKYSSLGQLYKRAKSRKKIEE